MLVPPLLVKMSSVSWRLIRHRMRGASLRAAYIAAEQRIGRVGAHAAPLMSASMLIGACFSNAIVEHTLGETAHGMSAERHARALACAIWKGLAL